MAVKRAKKSAKGAKKGAAKQVAAKTTRRPKPAASSWGRKAAKGRSMPRRAASPASAAASVSASKEIDQHIRSLDDWRGAVLNRMREWIREADPEVVEEWKWKKASSPGTPVWAHDGGICTGETYKQVVKLTFFSGASLNDPTRLFNSSLDGNTRRAIDIRQEDVVDESAFKELIRAAVAFNRAKQK